MKPRARTFSKGFRAILVLLVILSLGILGWVGWPWLGPRLERVGIHVPLIPVVQVQPPGAAGQIGKTVPPTATSTAARTDTAIPILLQNNGSPQENLRKQGLLILALRDGSFIHLFAYHPLYLPLTRLTNNSWDDITPALSPDGKRLAYASRQNGYWDLYILDLATGQKTRLTDTPEYEASPTWSPDGQWIAYERYNGISLDIYIQSLTDAGAKPIQLTDDPGIDRSPAWSPRGREIAFVSTRSGDEEIWLARLDDVNNRFVNISHSPLSRNRYPIWSADGRQLAWAADKNGDRQLAVWDEDQPDVPARQAGDGDWAAWGPDNSALFSIVRDPNASGLAAYATATGRLAMPYTPLPGAVYGLTWIKGPLPAWLEGAISSPDTSPAPTLWEPKLTRTVSPAGRVAVVPLADVSAPHPMLNDAVDEAFNSLRQQVAEETGWDALSSLENAYLPLTSPADPSVQDDWLYTGRAFSINPLILSAGWMVAVREDFNGQTFWHIYLKARYQDGSMGVPLVDQIWDLNARFSGDPRAYEQGGENSPTPVGYWVDLSELANRYSWERLPALTNWRTFYPGIRFNQYVMTGGLEWHQAMAELYPPEALATSTAMPTYTLTVTQTLEFTPRPVTATPTPTLTLIPTRRPTWTPQPGPSSP